MYYFTRVTGVLYFKKYINSGLLTIGFSIELNISLEPIYSWVTRAQKVETCI